MTGAAPQLQTIAPGGLELAYWEWPGEGPPILFVHATGFHGRCWDEVIRQLAGRRVIAPDMRGHGRSAKPDPPYGWHSFGEDLAAFAEALDLRDAIGVGHSMGGHSVVAAAARRPETFASLVLIDPTIFAPSRYGKPALDASFIARRRNVWTSPQEMYDRFAPRPPFARWKPEVLRDYCEYGLLPRDGAYVLACPPEVERDIYAHSTAPESDLHPVLGSIRQPAVVIRGGIPWSSDFFNLDASPTDPELAAKLPNARDVLLEGRSHYIPMETPEWVGRAILPAAGF